MSSTNCRPILRVAVLLEVVHEHAVVAEEPIKRHARHPLGCVATLEQQQRELAVI
jgi:hypothetical protein